MSLAQLSGISGPLVEDKPARLTVTAVFCELRPAFLSKGQVGQHYRAIARNGRVLLASAWPLDALAGRTVQLQVTIWHRRILPADPPEPYGILLGVWREPTNSISKVTYRAIVAAAPAPDGKLHLDLGGLRVLTLVEAS
ncbi:MAG TPA: hypothetical protein VEL76_11420 [Gemmataceae bacterium]|nr:hypothetical protein [Gemmataceae bacterium]